MKPTDGDCGISLNSFRSPPTLHSLHQHRATLKGDFAEGRGGSKR